MPKSNRKLRATIIWHLCLESVARGTYREKRSREIFFQGLFRSRRNVFDGFLVCRVPFGIAEYPNGYLMYAGRVEQGFWKRARMGCGGGWEVGEEVGGKCSYLAMPES